jgi:hypothetical protein
MNEDIKVAFDPVKDLLDDMAALGENWTRNRERGRMPNAIRNAMVMVAREIVIHEDMNRLPTPTIKPVNTVDVKQHPNEWLDPGLVHKLYFDHVPFIAPNASPENIFTAGVRAAEKHYGIQPPPQALIAPQKMGDTPLEARCNLERHAAGLPHLRTCALCGPDGICYKAGERVIGL